MNNPVDKRSVLLIVSLSTFLTSFIISSLNIALPTIGIHFNIDAILLSWVATSFLLSSAIFLVPFGRIADIFGTKKIFTYGVLIYTVSSLLSAISTSAIMLISSLFFQGIGSAMIVVTGVAILTYVFPSGERGKAIGFVVSTVYVGLSLGPLIGGFLTLNFGWRSIFLLNLPLGLIALTLIFWKIKQEWSDAKGEKFDLPGSIIYGITLVAVMYGLSLLPDFFGFLMILLGAAGILVFIRWELKVKSPVLNMNLFRQNTTFTFGNLAALINYSATFAAIFLLSLYLQFIKGFNPLDAGLILVSQPIMMAIFSPLAGRLSDKIEPRLVASTGMALTSLSLFLLTFLNEDTTLEFIVAILIFFGFSLAFFASPNTNSVMSSAEKRFYGVASGTLGTMRQTGMMISMGIVMLIFTIYIGRVQITPELYPLFVRSMNVAFMVFAVLCFGGVFASIRRGKVPKPDHS